MSIDEAQLSEATKPYTTMQVYTAVSYGVFNIEKKVVEDIANYLQGE
jgi:hypothetical protein